MEEATQGVPQGAETAMPAAPAERPFADAEVGTLFLAAIQAREKGMTEAALSLLDRALALEPAHRPSSYLMGHLLARAGQHRAALDHLVVACTGTPHFLPARHELSEVLIALRRWSESLAFCDETLEIAPSAQACFYRGATLAKLRRFEEAIQSYDRALALDPQHVESIYNRADALCRRWKLQAPTEENLLASLAGFQRVVDLRPDMAKAHLSLGFVLNRLDRLDESIASLDRGIALDAGNVEGRHTLACSLIANGDWARGWQEYEHRFNSLQMQDDEETQTKPADPRAHHLIPQFRGYPGWRGEPLEGKSILLLSEGGFGDVIQFYRFVPAVARMAADVQVVMPPALQPLLAPDQARPDIDAPYDFHCSLISLPLALKIRLDELPGVHGYLKPDAARVDTWRARLGPRRKPRVGLVWSGSPTHANDTNRSMQLADLRPLREADVDFICLQQFVRQDDQEEMKTWPALSFHGEQLRDFADTAALCELMDVVVSVDTSVAHVAGALAKPVWVMLPRAAEWRWMVGRADSPWYDSVRLFRQRRQGEWQPVVHQVLEALRRLPTPA